MIRYFSKASSITHTGLFLLFLFAHSWSDPSPELPGEEVNETKSIRKKSAQNVTPTQIEKPTNEKKWRAPNIDAQLSRDKTLIGMGTGAIFVPTFTEPQLEPEVVVYKKRDNILATGTTGHRIVVDPGEYIVRLGTGTLSRKMSYRITVEEGHTTVIEPDWGGLLVETINEDADYVDNEYELYRMDQFRSYGKGYGLKEERLKDLKTWILPPGMYKITKAGEDYTDFRNYITVQVNPGELTVVELVFDLNDNVISGGVKELRTRQRAGNNWSYGARFGGNMSLNSKMVNKKEESRTITVLTDLKLRMKYDNTKYLGINEFKAKNEFRKDEGEFNPEVDNVQLRSTWVRRWTKLIGPYMRGKLETHFVPKQVALSETDTVSLLDSDGNPASTLNNEDFEIQKPFFPLKFGEGAGVNLEFLNLYGFELSTQVGAALRQTITEDEFVYDATARTITPVTGENEVGLETAVISRLRLGTKVTVDFLSEIFFTNFVPRNFRVEDLSLELRYNLFKNMELSYVFEIEDVLERGRWADDRFELLHNLLFRISWNI